MKKILSAILVLALISCLAGTAFAGGASEVKASADPTFTVVIPPSIDFGIINKSMAVQSKPFSVEVQNAFIESGDTITVKNVTPDMKMYDNFGLGTNALAFALTNGTFSFIGNAAQNTTVTCDPSGMQYAGEYRGHMTFEVSYVDNVNIQRIVDDGYTGVSGAVLDGIPRYSTILAAYDAAAAGDIIFVEAGTYNQAITITKRVTIVGNGDATITTGAFRVLSPNVTIKNMKFAGANISDYDPAVSDSFNRDMSNLLVDGCTFTNVNIGVEFYAVAGSDNAENSKNINIRNSKFEDCWCKGIYLEQGKDVNITNNQFIRCGNDTRSSVQKHGAGVDINLKYSAYSTVTIQANTFTDCGNLAVEGTNGAAIQLKTRGTGGDDGYSTNPATLTGSITISGNIFNRNRVGLSIGEPGKLNGAPVYDLMVFASGNTFGTDADANIVANYIDNRAS